jgi:hypothetical protein
VFHNDEQQQDMKNINITTINKLGAIAFAGLISTGAAFAATTSGKDGMVTTTNAEHSHNEYSSNGLPMLAVGVQELSLGGHLNWEDNTDYSFDISYGRFVTPNWLLGVDAGVIGINSDKDYRVGVFAEYNFLTGTKWVPFVRGGLGYSNPDAADSGVTLGLDAGVKYFMRSNLAIYASIGGDWNVTGDGSSDGIAKQVNLGLKFYF